MASETRPLETRLSEPLPAAKRESLSSIICRGVPRHSPETATTATIHLQPPVSNQQPRPQPVTDIEFARDQQAQDTLAIRHIRTTSPAEYLHRDELQATNNHERPGYYTYLANPPEYLIVAMSTAPRRQ